MLNKKISENFDFIIYSGAFRDYIKENCLLSAECVEELQKIENFYFSYYSPQGDYITQFYIPQQLFLKR